MQTRILSVLLVMTAVTTAADARPRPPAKAKPTFAQATSFRACQQTTMFACGMRDASGHTYGTARELTVCTTYAFQPDGTYSVSSDSLPGDHGTYRLLDGKVTMTAVPDGDDIFGNPVQPLTIELQLSRDGDTLGVMKRVRP